MTRAMRPVRRRRGVVSVRVVLALCTMLVLGAGFAPPAWADEPVDLGAYATPLRFEAPDGIVLDVTGRDRYVATLEVRLAPDGNLVLVNDLPFEAYVEGIAELPVSWPAEALNAQAVAARTYAWDSLRRGTFVRRGLGFDICATTACQVFRGRTWPEAPGGEAWTQAVADTAGEVLLYAGQPILARYFSTSGGHTRNNEHVFPGDGARPYLQGVPDPDDEVSPIHRWQVRFTREEMNAILARGETLSAVVPVDNLEWIEARAGRTDEIRATGAGRTVTLPASQFRQFVSSVAPGLFPDRFPTDRDDGRRLPETLPSSRLSFELTDDEVVVDGRGWGHGVGMGQYGALGKAQRGLTYDEILHSYYTGVTLARAEALPATIRVGLTWEAEVVELRGDGPFRVLAGDRVVTDRGLGTWTVRRRPDRSMALEAPAGYGAPLVVAPTETTRTTPTILELVTFETVVNKPTELFLEIGTPGGEVRHRVGVVDPGRHAFTWSLDGPDGEPLPPGRYPVRLVAVDEEGDEDGAAVEVEIRGLAIPPLPPASVLGEPPPDPPARPAGLPAALAAGVVLGALAGVRLPVRRSE